MSGHRIGCRFQVSPLACDFQAAGGPDPAAPTELGLAGFLSSSEIADCALTCHTLRDDALQLAGSPAAGRPARLATNTDFAGALRPQEHAEHLACTSQGVGRRSTARPCAHRQLSWPLLDDLEVEQSSVVFKHGAQGERQVMPRAS